MGFFKNVKNLKDKVLEDDILKDLNREELHPVYDAIDKKAENEKIKAQKEREYYEKLNPEQKIEYNRIKKRNHNLKRLGAYGLYGAGMITGAGIPVMMVYGVSNILSSDSLTYDAEDANYKLNKQKKRGQAPNNKAKGKKKPRKYLSVSYDDEGHPKVKTLVDKDPYNIKNRYNKLMGVNEVKSDS